MSNVVKGFKKVFKKVFKVAKKIAPVVAIAGAVVATAGAAGLLAPAGAAGAAGATGVAGAAGAGAAGAGAAGGGMLGLGSSVAGSVAAGMEGPTLLGLLGSGVKGVAGWIKGNQLLAATALSGVAGSFQHKADMKRMREEWALRDQYMNRPGTYFATDADGTVHADAPWLQSTEEQAERRIMTDPTAYYDGTADQLAHTKRFPTPPPDIPPTYQAAPPSPMAVPGVAQEQIALGPQGVGVLERAAATQPGGVIEPNQMTVAEVPRWTWEEQYV